MYTVPNLFFDIVLLPSLDSMITSIHCLTCFFHFAVLCLWSCACKEYSWLGSSLIPLLTSGECWYVSQKFSPLILMMTDTDFGGKVDFCEQRKTGEPEKTLGVRLRSTNHSPRMNPGLNPGHSGGRRAAVPTWLTCLKLFLFFAFQGKLVDFSITPTHIWTTWINSDEETMVFFTSIEGYRFVKLFSVSAMEY